MPTEIRIYAGQTGAHAVDGFAGFRLGVPYTLTFEDDGQRVVVELPHAPGHTTEMSSEEFALRFRRRVS